MSNYNEAFNDVIEKLWNIATISPEHGNALMDILGSDRYQTIGKLHDKKTDVMEFELNRIAFKEAIKLKG